MKLEVGMYVRTELYGISEIIYMENLEWIEIDKNKDFLIHRDTILKASYNIIDLIEVGDVIVDKEGHKYSINYEFETDYNNEYKSYEITIDDYITLFLKDGLSIITKEQIEQICYRIGDDK